MVKIEDIALREKKFAKTKIDLLNTFYEKLKTEKLEDISVKDLCMETNISYKTFFNYFSKKSDLLLYYSHLWSIEAQYYIKNELLWLSPLKRIEKLFDYTCDKYEDNLRIIKELVSHMAINDKLLNFQKLKLAEYVIAFPDKEWIEEFNAKLIDEVIYPHLEEAIRVWEIKKDTDIKTLTLTLRSIFFWIILSTHKTNVNEIRWVYNKQLQIIWKSIK